MKIGYKEVLRGILNPLSITTFYFQVRGLYDTFILELGYSVDGGRAQNIWLVYSPEGGKHAINSVIDDLEELFMDRLSLGGRVSKAGGYDEGDPVARMLTLSEIPPKIYIVRREVGGEERYLLIVVGQGRDIDDAEAADVVEILSSTLAWSILNSGDSDIVFRAVGDPLIDQGAKRFEEIVGELVGGKLPWQRLLNT